jgi:ribosomal protein L12E/L44/L45/RPP1/RPP2
LKRERVLAELHLAKTNLELARVEEDIHRIRFKQRQRQLAAQAAAAAAAEAAAKEKEKEKESNEQTPGTPTNQN